MPRLVKGRRGVAAIEFALASPLLFLLFVGFLDIVYLGRGHMRVQSTTSQIGQIISQCTTIGSGDTAQITAFAQNALRPYSDNGRGWAVVVTAIQVDASNKATAAWVMDSRTAAQKASFATAGPTLPANLQPSTDEMVYRTEVFANIESTLFTSANNLLAGRLGSRSSITLASSSLLHVSRSPSAAKLGNINSSESCL